MDFILSRYNQPEIILDMFFADGLAIVEKGYEKFIEERIFQKWLVDYGKFYDPRDEKTFIPFDLYLRSHTGDYKTMQQETKKKQINKQVKLNEIANKLMKQQKEAKA